MPNDQAPWTTARVVGSCSSTPTPQAIEVPFCRPEFFTQHSWAHGVAFALVPCLLLGTGGLEAEVGDHDGGACGEFLKPGREAAVKFN